MIWIRHFRRPRGTPATPPSEPHPFVNRRRYQDLEAHQRLIVRRDEIKRKKPIQPPTVLSHPDVLETHLL